MSDPTVGPELTIVVGNRVVNIHEHRKSLRYLSNTISTLGSTQSPNKWHGRDPHIKKGWIECSFDLQFHQLPEILEPQGTGAQKRPIT